MRLLFNAQDLDNAVLNDSQLLEKLQQFADEAVRPLTVVYIHPQRGSCFCALNNPSVPHSSP